MSDASLIDIDYLADLCRINLTDSEKETISKSIMKILSYMTLIEEIDTTDVPSCTHVLETVINVMREDVEGPTMSREEFLKNAPDHVAGMIKVPPVIQFE